MRRKYLSIFFVISICISLSSYSQGTTNTYSPELPSMILPSPVALQFQKYMGYKPDLTTGTVNVDIPLYTLKVNNFELPFSLKYHTSGIKVHDNPYPVGYGWTLMPGLRISRIIMGRADDNARTREIRGAVLKSTELEAFNYLRSIVTNEDPSTFIDSQYDIFTLHLPDKNLPFLIEKNNNKWEAIIIDSPLKIEILTESNSSRFSNEEIIGFKITDENGYIYEFGGDLNYLERKMTDLDVNVITSWVIKQITLPGNNILDFYWTPQATEKRIPDNNTHFEYIVDDVGDAGELCPQGIFDPFRGIIEGADLFDHKVNDIQLFLEKIIFSNGTISLTYNQNKRNSRLMYLEKFIVHNSSRKIIQECIFDYGEDPESPLLKKIITTGQSFYKFNYDSNKFSFSKFNQQDYWGYFNGKNNGSLVPKIQINEGEYFKGSLKWIPTHYNPYFGQADRSIDPIKMQAYILKEIIYPTGGYTKFEYEPHEFYGKTPSTVILNNPVLTKGGGLRVKSTKTRANEESPEIIKTYKYGENENGLGHATAVPSLETFIFENYYHSQGDCFKDPYDDSNNCDEFSYRMVRFGRYSHYNSFLQFNTPIWYDVVTEYTGKEKTIFHNEYKPDEIYELRQNHGHLYGGETFQNFPPPLINAYTNLYAQSPKVKMVELFLWDGNTSAYKPLESHYYKYIEPCFSDQRQSLYVDRFVIRAEKNSAGFPERDFRNNGTVCDLISTNNYFYEHYHIHQCTRKLSQHIKINYQDGDSIIQKTEYEYIKHDNKLLNLRSKTYTTKNGETIKEEILYPHDNLNDLTTEQKQYVPQMIARNLINTPIQLKKWRKDKATDFHLLQQKTVQYKLFPNNNLVLPEKEYFKTTTYPEEVRIQYHNYDQYGNPVYLTKDNATDIVYLWSYRGMYPIAEISNASYTDVKNALNYSTDTQIGFLFSSINPDMKGIDHKLRAYNWNKPVSITTHAYKPLIGETSMIDSRGLETTYHYDDFNRLRQVKNNNNKVMEAYSYNYSNYQLLLEYKPMSVSISSAQNKINYDRNETGTFILSVENGSGDFQYSWSMYDGSSNLIWVNDDDIDANYWDTRYTIPFPGYGNYLVKCTVYDLKTGLNETAEMWVYTNLQVGFSNIIHDPSNYGNSYEYSTSKTSAEINLSQDMNVQFLFSRTSSQGQVECIINGQSFVFNGSNEYEKIIESRLKKGRNSIVLSIREENNYQNRISVMLQIHENMEESGIVRIGEEREIEAYF